MITVINDDDDKYNEDGLIKPEHCNHIKIEKAEMYYGILETQYYSYYFCEDCGEEVENEPYEA
jgi:hypothetical protein